MTLHLLQPGHGPRRVVVLAYFVSDAAALASFGPTACIAVDNDGTQGRYARPPGPAGVASLDASLAAVRAQTGAFEVAAVVLVGWSMGAQAVRGLLAAGARPSAILALDGTSGSVPPSAAQLAPWLAAAERARAGEALLVITATQQVYTRDLPLGQRYESTLHVLSEVWSGNRPSGPADLLPPGEYRDGDLLAAVHASARYDGEAHKREQRVHLPELVRQVVLPWLAEAAPITVRRAAPLTPTLRRGSTGPAVRELQRLLNERGGAGPPLAEDGDFGRLTLAAVRVFQRATGLDADGVAGPATWAALLAPEGEATPAPPGPPPFPSLSEAEKDALFGPLRWEAAPTAAEPGGVRLLDGYVARELVSIVVPQLRGVRGARADGRITMHRLAVVPMLALFERWEAEGLLPLVLSWAGSVAFRLVRGGATLSSHARGISFDINADFNGLGRPPLAVGVKGSVQRLVPAARHIGWFWGGDWERQDGMHFELARLDG